MLDTKIYLNADGFGDTIKAKDKAFDQDKAKAMIFMCRHLHEGFKAEYLNGEDPLVLQNKLNERYDHQKTMILPKGRSGWMHLRLQDFKIASEYNSTMFNITTRLLLCGENITDEERLEKTYASNMVLHQQYREKRFKKYGCETIGERLPSRCRRMHSLYKDGLKQVGMQSECCGSLNSWMHQFERII